MVWGALSWVGVVLAWGGGGGGAYLHCDVYAILSTIH